MTSPKPMGPIERELREWSENITGLGVSTGIWPTTLAWLGLSQYAQFTIWYGKATVDDWSEAIEAASELGL